MIKYNADNTFTVTYTNKDIMDKLNDIETKLEASHSLAHKAIWTAGTAITLCLFVLGVLFSA
jgi:hypothetical protein